MMMGKNYKFWFVAGPQDLHREERLANTAGYLEIIVEKPNESGILPFELAWKPTPTDDTSIRQLFNETNGDEKCAGIVTWMHAFSPAKSWILELQEYRKPLLYLYIQFNQEIPYDTIDVGFMNENQSVHGNRGYGHIATQMEIGRKVIMGHWSSEAMQRRMAEWMRIVIGIMESSHIHVTRVADNTRNVAVAEGDEMETQIKFGWEIDAYPVGEIADYVKDVSAGDVDALVKEHYNRYKILLEGRDEKEFRRHVAVQVGIEIGFERFSKEKNYQAIVTHFGDLGALQQLPRLTIQRLVEKGYGFGGEGDWKTATMVWLIKIMASEMKGAKGISFMKDCAYNLIPGKEGTLQAHMLEVCPMISGGPVGIKVCQLSMDDWEGPARLTSAPKTGPAVTMPPIDLENRFCLVIDEMDCKKVEEPMSKLPVTMAFWAPQPSPAAGAENWVLTGGTHHTTFSYDLTTEQMGDQAVTMNIEAVCTDGETTIRGLKNELRWDAVAFRQRQRGTWPGAGDPANSSQTGRGQETEI